LNELYASSQQISMTRPQLGTTINSSQTTVQIQADMAYCQSLVKAQDDA